MTSQACPGELGFEGKVGFVEEEMEENWRRRGSLNLSTLRGKENVRQRKSLWLKHSSCRKLVRNMAVKLG